MSNSDFFDLETAIAAWRHVLKHERFIQVEDLDELEQHIRDQVKHLASQGHSEESAFQSALQAMGSFDETKAAYRGIFWRKLLHKRELRLELRWKLAMAGHYVTVALRNLKKQKLFTFITVLSLAIGLAVCVLMLLFVRDELSFDRFHEDHERIYRVSHPSFDREGDYTGDYPYEPAPLAAALKEEIPEVEEAVRFYESQAVIRSNLGVFEEEILLADSSVLSVFTFPLLQGNPAEALAVRNSVILSEEVAKQLFDQQDPIGKPLSIRLGEQFEEVVVTGIARPVPSTSSIRFSILAPLGLMPRETGWDREDWRVVRAITYVRLAPAARLNEVEEKLVAFRQLHYPWEAEEERQGRPPVRFELQPITETHLNQWTIGGLTPASDPLYSYILGAIAMLVLGVACINFMTLAIGRSLSRTREVAVRKVVGAVRTQIMGQFWGEALVLALCALILGMLLAAVSLPFFNEMAEKEIHFDLFKDAYALPALLLLLLLTGFLAGSYPALLLSGIKPIEILRNTFVRGGSTTFIKWLVGAQLGISVFLFGSAQVMFRQLDFLRAQNPGYERENLVVIPSSERSSVFTRAEVAHRVFDAYRKELGARSDIIGITNVSRSPALHLPSASIQRQLAAGYHRDVGVTVIDSSFLRVMGVEVIAGRNLDPHLRSDVTQSVLINETMARRLSGNAVGQSILDVVDPAVTDSMPELIVAGVVRDFNPRSLHFSVQPLLFRITDESNPQYLMRHVLVRIRPGDVPATLGALREAWQRAAPDIPFDYSFLEQDVDLQYQAEERWGLIVISAALLTIIITCLGLFGLATLAVRQRTKEIGIRKVLGASSSGIMLMIFKDYVRMAATAALIASPLSYLVLKRWLDGFAFRIPSYGLEILLSGLLIISFVLFTISIQTMKASIINPVKCLRDQ